MVVCDNCGEYFTYSGEGDATCEVCGVVQQLYSQTVVEEFSASYTQTQKIGKLKPTETQTQAPEAEGEDAESRDLHFIIGIQMILDGLCKTLVKSYGFSNQLEIEAKNIWTRYLTFVVENDVPIANMFSDPLTKGQKYYVDAHYLKRSFQVPKDIEPFNLPKRMHKVIRDMTHTSFEYATVLCMARMERQRGAAGQMEGDRQDEGEGDAEAAGGDAGHGKKTQAHTYDYAEVKAYLEDTEMSSVLENVFDAKVELPRSRRCSPTGFPIYILAEVVMQRRLPMMPWLPTVWLYLERTNPYRIAFMMETLYRHDFLWRLLYAYPNLEPLPGFERHLGRYGEVTTAGAVAAIEKHPLEWDELEKLAARMGVTPGEEKVRRLYNTPRAMRVELINAIYTRITSAYFGKKRDPDAPAFDLSWVAPRMDLHLVCGILFVALLKCRYAVVVGDVVRWVLQGRVPLRSSASLLPERILSAAFREGLMAPRMRFASSQQEEMAYNLFTNAREQHSTRHLELTVSRLVVCGIFADPSGEAEGEPLRYNVHGLCRRLVHQLRLPNNVIAVADMVASRLSQGDGDGDDAPCGTEYLPKPTGRMASIYGTRLGHYPAHVFAAACVLAACRMLWPVFHYHAPAFPRREPPQQRGRATDGGAGGDTVESHVVKYDRFPQLIEFDGGRMRWVVRVAAAIGSEAAFGALVREAVLRDAALSIDSRQFLSQLAQAMGQSVYVDPLGTAPPRRGRAEHEGALFRSVCETMLPGDRLPAPEGCGQPDDSVEHEWGRELFFDARRLGYHRAGVRALLWLLHHSPCAGVRALSEYRTACDTRSLRRMALEYAVLGEPSLLSRSVLRLYTGPSAVLSGCERRMGAALEANCVDMWANLAGFWSGSVAGCLGLREEDYERVGVSEWPAPLKVYPHEVDRVRDVLKPRLEKDEALETLRAALPGNREVHYTVTELFRGYPYYSGWSPEKSLELDAYRCLVPNQRVQALDAARETLAMRIVQSQNDTWTYVADSLEAALRLDTGGFREWPDLLEGASGDAEGDVGDTVEQAYRSVLEHMQPLFQEMETITTVGRTLPANPWRDFDVLKGIVTVV